MLPPAPPQVHRTRASLCLWGRIVQGHFFRNSPTFDCRFGLPIVFWIALSTLTVVAGRGGWLVASLIHAGTAIFTNVAHLVGQIALLPLQGPGPLAVSLVVAVGDALGRAQM